MAAKVDYCGVGSLVLPIQDLASDRPQGWGEPPGVWRTSWLSWAPRGTPDLQGPFLPSSTLTAGVMPMTSGSMPTTPTSTPPAGAPRQGIPCSLLFVRTPGALSPFPTDVQPHPLQLRPCPSPLIACPGLTQRALVAMASPGNPHPPCLKGLCYTKQCFWLPQLWGLGCRGVEGKLTWEHMPRK